MAKKRAQTRTKGQPAASRRAKRPLALGQARPTTSAPASNPGTSTLRSTYIEAVALYERGIEALQKHDYQNAVELLEAVLKRFPEEKELAERVRLYLNVCARHVASKEHAPATVEERLYAATLAINGGEPNEALRHLRLVRDEDPDNSHALYMLAVAHAQRGEQLEAVAHLSRAIALNPENRTLARRDPDLDPLRENEAFQAALGLSPGRGAKNRAPARPRTGR